VDLNVHLHITIRIGELQVLESTPRANRFGVVFEDHGETGYFYGIDVSTSDLTILDALEIYNVSAFKDEDRERKLEIVWTDDGLRAALIINGSVQAVYDFMKRRAACRANFPPADGSFIGVRVLPALHAVRRRVRLYGRESDQTMATLKEAA